jgi:hypothetical protein
MIGGGMHRISKRTRSVILHTLIIVAAIAVIQGCEYLFKLYLAHLGTELAAGGILSRVILASSEKTETLAEVSESLEEIVK